MGPPKSNRRRLVISTWLRLHQFLDLAEKRLRLHLRSYDLNRAQFDVIVQVGHREGLMQRELAENLIVTPGNITQLLDRMEGLGLVTRDREGRCNRIGLTSRGREVYRRVVPEHEKLVSEQFESLSRDDLSELAGIARRLLLGAKEQKACTGSLGRRPDSGSQTQSAETGASQ